MAPSLGLSFLCRPSVPRIKAVSAFCQHSEQEVCKLAFLPFRASLGHTLTSPTFPWDLPPGVPHPLSPTNFPTHLEAPAEKSWLLTEVVKKSQGWRGQHFLTTQGWACLKPLLPSSQPAGKRK